MTKNKLKTFFKQDWVVYLIVALIVAVVLPLGFSVLKIAILWRVGLLFFVINGIVAFYSGYDIVKHQRHWYYLLFMPVLFGLMVLVRYADYGYWFVPIYLLLSYLGMNTAKDWH